MNRRYSESNRNLIWCIYCDHFGVIELGDHRLKCKKCGGKFTPQKYAKDTEVFFNFIKFIRANETARNFNQNYGSVRKKYMRYRKNILDALVDRDDVLLDKNNITSKFFGSSGMKAMPKCKKGDSLTLGYMNLNRTIISTIQTNVSPSAVFKDIETNGSYGVIFHTHSYKSPKGFFIAKPLRVLRPGLFKQKLANCYWLHARVMEQLRQYPRIAINNFPLYFKTAELYASYSTAALMEIAAQIRSLSLRRDPSIIANEKQILNRTLLENYDLKPVRLLTQMHREILEFIIEEAKDRTE